MCRSIGDNDGGTGLVLDAVRALLSMNVEVNGPSKDGKTALTAASEQASITLDHGRWNRLSRYANLIHSMSSMHSLMEEYFRCLAGVKASRMINDASSVNPFSLIYHY